MKKKIFDLERSDLGKNVSFETNDGESVAGTLRQIHHLRQLAVLTIGDGYVCRVEDPSTVGTLR